VLSEDYKFIFTVFLYSSMSGFLEVKQKTWHFGFFFSFKKTDMKNEILSEQKRWLRVLQIVTALWRDTFRLGFFFEMGFEPEHFPINYVMIFCDKKKHEFFHECSNICSPLSNHDIFMNGRGYETHQKNKNHDIFSVFFFQIHKGFQYCHNKHSKCSNIFSPSSNQHRKPIMTTLRINIFMKKNHDILLGNGLGSNLTSKKKILTFLLLGEGSKLTKKTKIMTFSQFKKSGFMLRLSGFWDCQDFFWDCQDFFWDCQVIFDTKKIDIYWYLVVFVLIRIRKPSD
jgi:hypothetical protein